MPKTPSANTLTALGCLELGERLWILASRLGITSEQCHINDSCAGIVPQAPLWL